MNSPQALYLVRHGSADRAFEMRPIEIPQSESLKEDQVLIEVEASGLNFADIMARQGLYQEAPPMPCVVGYEVVGKVVGSKNARLPLGQRVLAFTRFGGYASHVVVPAEVAVPIPDSIPAAEATALATQACTAYYAAEEMTRIQPGDQVLVQAAAGGVGSFLVQLAKLRGATVYGTASSTEKLEALRPFGLDVPINYAKEPFEVACRRELQKRGKKGMDLIFDSIGGSAVKKGLSILGPGGRMVCFGAAQMSSDRKNPVQMLKVVLGFGFLHPIQMMMNSKGLIGINMLRLADDRPDVLARCMKNVVEMTAQGKLRVLKAEAFPAIDIAQAHERLGSRGSIGKVALLWK
ncbi:MAG: zinc-binding dehydrogenase [Bdellovibrionales bacterium]|nr:zinc-binding dehydrogenase [Bdellovibrionales bacterium]